MGKARQKGIEVHIVITQWSYSFDESSQEKIHEGNS